MEFGLWQILKQLCSRISYAITINYWILRGKIRKSIVLFHRNVQAYGKKNSKYLFQKHQISLLEREWGLIPKFCSFITLETGVRTCFGSADLCSKRRKQYKIDSKSHPFFLLLPLFFFHTFNLITSYFLVPQMLEQYTYLFIKTSGDS